MPVIFGDEADAALSAGRLREAGIIVIPFCSPPCPKAPPASASASPPPTPPEDWSWPSKRFAAAEVAARKLRVLSASLRLGSDVGVPSGCDARPALSPSLC
jgi:hypothetical protein